MIETRLTDIPFLVTDSSELLSRCYDYSNSLFSRRFLAVPL